MVSKMGRQSALWPVEPRASIRRATVSDHLVPAFFEWEGMTRNPVSTNSEDAFAMTCGRLETVVAWCWTRSCPAALEERCVQHCGSPAGHLLHHRQPPSLEALRMQLKSTFSNSHISLSPVCEQAYSLFIMNRLFKTT